VIVHVRYFAAAREAAGRETEAVEVEAEATVADLLGILERRHAPLSRLRLRAAVGVRFAAPGARLAPGDEVALIPPVSGG
jgi:molybdopterin converting factor subunit 1